MKTAKLAKLKRKNEPMSLHDVFIMKLQALYDIESQLIDALPIMAKNATDIELKDLINEHLTETKMHLQRIIDVFETLDIEPDKMKVKGIKGIIDDAEWAAEYVNTATARDATIVASAQYVEHYEMAGYASAIEWARIMNHKEAVEMLKMTLDEEEMASDKLLKLSLAKINREALGEDENTED